MRYIDPVTVLISAVLLAAALAIGGCGGPVDPYGTWTERPDGAAADAGGACDQRIGLWCVQALGDGGGDALGAGEECDPDGADRCASPVACSFESTDYTARCEALAADGPITPRCCQYASTHSMVDGRVVVCHDCGSGWECPG